MSRLREESRMSTPYVVEMVVWLIVVLVFTGVVMVCVGRGDER